MKKHNFKRMISLLLCLCILASLATTAFALESDTTSVIDTDKTASITITKIDFTNAVKDGVWNNSYVSTGRQDSEVEDKLVNNAVRAGDDDADGVEDLGNGQTSNGYAIKGAEYAYLKVANIVTFSETANDQHPDYNLTQVLYAFDKDAAADLLAAIGLPGGQGRYENADMLNYETTAPLPSVDAGAGVDARAIAQVRNCWYYQSDVLVNALRESLAANATTVKDALESYITTHGGTTMTETDANGKTSVSGLPLGLYLVVETKVPEMVTNTTNPFLISLPSTSIDGGGVAGSLTSANVTDGGEVWMYDLFLYPKNETGIPTLEKTVRESQADTGNNNASDSITDGYEHTATGSAGDVMEYQIVSTLPAITSNSTKLAEYFFFDSIQKGLTYTKGDVKIEFFTDTKCTDLVDTWTEDDAATSTYFTVTYSPSETVDTSDTAMTIAFSTTGLNVVNNSQKVYTNGSEVRRGYSDLTVRVTYTAKIDSNNTVTYGDTGNKNTVVLAWRRSNETYYDTLVDDCHVCATRS